MNKHYVKNLVNHVVDDKGIALEEIIIFGKNSLEWNKRGYYVDHKNGDPLDCRRENLVIVTLDGIKARDNNDIESINNRLEFDGILELLSYIKSKHGDNISKTDYEVVLLAKQQFDEIIKK